MKKSVGIFIILLVMGISLLGAGYAVREKNPVDESKVVDDMVFATLEVEETVEVIIGTSEKESVMETLSPGVSRDILARGGFVAEVTQNELDKLIRDERVGYIEPIRIHETTLNDAVDIVNVSLVWTIAENTFNLTGITQTVCVIDTGVNFTHPDLLGKNLTACNLDCVNGPSCVQNCSENDFNGHGTHVAGIVGAQGGIAGIAPGGNIIGLKVFPGSSRTGATTTGIANAITWCTDNKQTYNISVITMSLGTTTLYETYCDVQQQTFSNAIANATAVNISVVASTGNSGSGVLRNTTAIAAPACVQNAIPVSATDDDDSISTYGHYNSLVSLMAPGTSINSTCIPSESSSGYCLKTGTSMSTPMVAASLSILNQIIALRGETRTPAQLETILNETGNQITDGTLTFSRIDVYSAVLSFDEEAPNVTLVSPTNSLTNLEQNKTFSCSATDWLLANATLFIWNATHGIINQTTNAMTGTNATFSLNITDIPLGNYRWNCLFTDAQNNEGLASSNYTFTIGGVSVTLDSPTNANYTNQTNQTFSCTAYSEQSANLTNVTFSFFNESSSLLFNTTENLSVGNTTYTLTTNYSLSDEQTYEWTCEAYNENQNSSVALENYTITLDTTIPEITLQAPEDGASYTSDSQQLTFEYNLTENSPANCSLYAQSTVVNNSIHTNNTLTHNLSAVFTPATYTWYIACADYAGNMNSSSSRTFTITAEEVVVNDGGSGGPNRGGGGGGSPPEPINETEEPVPPEEPQDDTEDFITNIPDEEPQLGPAFGGLTIGEFIASLLPIVIGVLVLFVATMYLAHYLDYVRKQQSHARDFLKKG